MTDPRTAIQKLRHRAADLSDDLDALEALLAVDIPSSLNKIRFITEKVLQRLCKNHSVSWGQAEPTLERMIGPLIAADYIPKSIALHVRTIQTNTSPGSHYQDVPLSNSHVAIAQNALIEFVEWYYQQAEGKPAHSEPKKFLVGAPRISRRPLWLALAAAFCLACAGLVTFLVSKRPQENTPTNKREAAKVGSEPNKPEIGGRTPETKSGVADEGNPLASAKHPKGLLVELLSIKADTSEKLVIRWRYTNQTKQVVELVKEEGPFAVPLRSSETWLFYNDVHYREGRPEGATDLRQNILKDSDGKYEATPVRKGVKIGAGQTFEVWAKFPLPSRKVETISVHLADIEPFDDVRVPFTPSK
jgi:hypothetical protein